MAEFHPESRAKLVAFYHRNCYDGTLAAAIFLNSFPGTRLIPYEYGDALPPFEELAGHHVYLLDLTFDTEVLLELTQHAYWVTVVDHHPKARVQAQDRPHARRGNLSIVTDSVKDPASGAQLVWRLLHRTAPEPNFVRWIGKRDRWVFDEPQIRPFVMGITGLGFDPVTWEAVLFQTPSIDLEPYMLQGEAVAAAIDGQLDYLQANAVHWIEIAGHRVAAVNAPKFLASEMGERLYRRYSVERSPFVVIYYDEHGKRCYSLRCHVDSLEDMGQIARQFGGDGHRCAAGFKTTMPNTFNSDVVVMEPVRVRRSWRNVWGLKR